MNFQIKELKKILNIDLDDSQKFLLKSCFFALFCSGLVSVTLGSIMPDLKAAYNFTDTFGGLMLAGHSIGVLTAGLISGVLPLYLGNKKSILILFAMAFIGAFLLIISNWSSLLLILGFALIGLGRGSLLNFNTRTVNILTNGSAAAANILHSMFAMGAIAAPILFYLVNKISGWRVWLVIIIFLGIAALYRLFKANMPNYKASSKNYDLSFLRDKKFLIKAGMIFFYICAEYALLGWLVTYMNYKNFLNSSQFVSSMLWVVIFAGRLLCAAFASKFKVKNFILIASIGSSLFFAGLLLSENISSVFICVACLGLSMAGLAPMIYADANYYSINYQLANGTLVFASAIGGAIMPFAVGVMADLGGFNYGMAAILFAFVLLIIFAALNLILDHE
ncbi:MAG: MFS transporter [Synergistaceae bacterium]|nr:MFS transporter [Synergistaceae bacterium]MBR0097146.1 MFS transporter [Synergistaceae bacterium]MBR0220997.1 MFS transporter [Synergistaceae bacterium]